MGRLRRPLAGRGLSFFPELERSLRAQERRNQKTWLRLAGAIIMVTDVGGRGTSVFVGRPFQHSPTVCMIDCFVYSWRY